MNGFIIFVSPLATLAFELCVLGDTGLKIGVGEVQARGRGGVQWNKAQKLLLAPVTSPVSSN